MYLPGNLVRFKWAKPNAEIYIWPPKRSQIYKRNPRANPNGPKEVLFRAFMGYNGFEGILEDALDQIRKILSIICYLGSNGYYTVDTGELTGILMALWTAKDFLWSKQGVYIFTDNQAAALVISDPLTRRTVSLS